MAKFKVGDKVWRNSAVTRNMHERTGIRRGALYTVCAITNSGTGVRLAESMERAYTFEAAAFSLESPGLNWDVNEALRLRGLAVQAIQEYNTYLLQQPLLEAIEPPPPIK